LRFSIDEELVVKERTEEELNAQLLRLDDLEPMEVRGSIPITNDDLDSERSEQMTEGVQLKNALSQALTSPRKPRKHKGERRRQKQESAATL